MIQSRLASGQEGEKNPNWRGGKTTTRNGYILVRLAPDSPFYPMVRSNGYVAQHRLVMAKKLGRCLDPSEIVHHINGRRDINIETNLELKGAHLHRQSYTEGFNEGFKVGQRAKIGELEREIRLLRLEVKQLRQLLQPQLLEVQSD
jgi:hypothetical protein